MTVGDQLRRQPEQILSTRKIPKDTSQLVNGRNVYVIVIEFSDFFCIYWDTENYLYVQTTSLGEFQVQRNFENYTECRITLAEKTFWRRLQGIAYQKNSPLTQPIDRQY